MDSSEAQSVWFDNQAATIEYGALVLLLTSDLKRFLITIRKGQKLHTHQGIYAHDEIVGKRTGEVVRSQLQHEALLFQPGLSDLIKHLKRGTQIIYPEDAAYLVQRMNLRAGCRVVEAGTGSGGLTTALAWSVAPTGRVYTYEARPENYLLARNNLERVSLLPYVQMLQKSIIDGFEQTDADALVLDVREPWKFLAHVRSALKPGGFFASLVPTVNQVSELLIGLESEGFADISVEELIVRRYKPVPERLRPEDEMVAHTGYLIFARLVAQTLDPARWQSKERKRFHARQDARRRIEAQEAEAEARRAAGGPRYPKLPLPG